MTTIAQFSHLAPHTDNLRHIWRCICCHSRMPPDDEEVVRDFMEHLDRGDLNGHLAVELPKLSYEQLLRVARIIAERIEKQSKVSGSGGM